MRCPSRSFLRRPTRLAGFTLIELLIVIIIIGILMAIGMSAYLNYQAKAKDTSAKADLTTAFKALAAAKTLNNGNFPSQSSMLQQARQDEPSMSFISGLASSATSGKINVNLTGNTLTLSELSKSGKLATLTATSADNFSQPTYTIGLPGYAGTVMANAPVGYWQLGSSGTTASDMTTGANTGTWNTAPTSVAAPGLLCASTPNCSTDGAATFTGTSNRASIPFKSTLNTTQFSVEMWVKPASTNGWLFTTLNNPASPTSGWQVGLTGAGPYQVRAVTVTAGGTTSTGTSTGTLTAGTRYQIVFTDDGSQGCFYINGALDRCQAGWTNYTVNGAGAEYIGGDGTSYLSPTGATVDDVSVYNSALTLAQVQAHYNAGK